MSKFTPEQFLEFNSQISSEMFISVISILQERLPCAGFYFRQRRLFKTNKYAAEGPDDAMAVDSGNGMQNFDTVSRQSYHTRNSTRSKISGSEIAQYVTAIA